MFDNSLFSTTFFVGEVNSFEMDGEVKPGVFDRAENFQSGQDTQRAVEPPAIGDGVEVGAKKEGFSVGVSGAKNGAVVACGVLLKFQTVRLDALAEPGAGGEMTLTKSGAVDAAVPGGADLGEFVEVFLEALGVGAEGFHERHMLVGDFETRRTRSFSRRPPRV